MQLIGRFLIMAMAAVIGLGVSAVVFTGGAQKAADEIAYAKRDDLDEIELAGDDDDGNSGNSNSRQTSGANSNDRTGSGHSRVSRDRDRSGGDKTRDRTRDKTNNRTRDRTGGQTNDRSKNDTR
jgi:hypothetical protein